LSSAKDFGFSPQKAGISSFSSFAFDIVAGIIGNVLISQEQNA
jgi:hypothetical protein